MMRHYLRPLLVTALLTLGGCSGGMLDAAGPVAKAERLLFFNASAIMLAIILPTMVATLLFAFWFRAGNARAKRQPEWQYSGRLELLVWSVPALAVMFLGGLAWISSHQLDPSRPLESNKTALEIEAVSLDWRWLFIYPQQGVASINRLAVPIGAPVQVRISSASVMNMFLVPQLAGGMMAMNGMVTQVHLQADRAGEYHGLSGHYSGAGFSDMGFTVVALPPGNFSAWVDNTKISGGKLDQAAYKALTQQTRDTRVQTFGAVTPGLFDAILDHTLPPGNGPGEAAHVR